jgi:uracil-DNA glycosylase
MTDFEHEIFNAPREYSYFEGLSMFDLCVVHPSWTKFFTDMREYLEDINTVLERDVNMNGEFFPEKHNIFRACQIPLDSINVVIIGQEPYYGRHAITSRSKAQGFSFSVDENDTIPSSLINVYAELEKDIIGWKRPKHGNLLSWTTQGVMLLNLTLTVRPDEPNSHQYIWDGIVIAMIQEIQKANPNVVFVLWGRQAQDMQIHLKDKTQRFVAGHPSGRSPDKGFFGCKHFSKINKYLKSKGVEPVDWTL